MIVPMVSEGTMSMDICSRLLKDRIILLYEEINDKVAEMVVSQLLYLQSVDKDEKVTIYINSPGGSISAGLAIIDTMDLISCPVSTVCMGMAASMASVILTKGEKGQRFITKNSQVLIHQPLSGANLSQQTEIQILADNIKGLRKKLEAMIAECTGQKETKVNKDCERDNYLSAEKAVEYGLVDGIIEKEK